jgi:hypothetical protein
VQEHLDAQSNKKMPQSATVHTLRTHAHMRSAG